jgi:hypothetical protein
LELITLSSECSGSLSWSKSTFPFQFIFETQTSKLKHRVSLKVSSCSMPPQISASLANGLVRFGDHVYNLGTTNEQYRLKCINYMIKGIKHMYAIDQSKLCESKTFNSLRSLQKVFSYKGLVKILASWFSVLT